MAYRTIALDYTFKDVLKLIRNEICVEIWTTQIKSEPTPVD